MYVVTTFNPSYTGREFTYCRKCNGFIRRGEECIRMVKGSGGYSRSYHLLCLTDAKGEPMFESQKEKQMRHNGGE